ncbi:MAG: Asp23/Gls24 family envelope stress response protein, partial [Halanaerobiaceae bacterium]
RVVAYDYEIPLILDDGLLIQDGKIIGGSSAKRENSKLAAIKRAIFHHQNHLEEVKRAIKASQADKILVLGTSTEMVEKIVSRLDLPEIKEYIMIEDIASEEEIAQAIETRNRENKHVIPVPTIEVKSQFLGYFIDSLKVLFNREEDDLSRESTVVRARFNYLGGLIIYNKVFRDVVYYVSSNTDVINQLRNVRIAKSEEGMTINIVVIIQYGDIIPEALNDFKNELARSLEHFTGVDVKAINIDVAGMEVDRDDLSSNSSSR